MTTALLITGHDLWADVLGGTALRGRTWLEALANEFDHVDVLSLHPGRGTARPKLARTIARANTYPYDPKASELDRTALGLDPGYDLIVVQRLALVRAYYLLDVTTTKRWLDLDDIESLTWLRQEVMYGGIFTAEREQQYERLKASERAASEEFDLITVCSPGDAAKLRRAHPDGKFEWIPNSIPDEVAKVGKRRLDSFRWWPERSYKLLFVGSLNYWPNNDAVWYAVNHILPAIRRRMPDVNVELHVVGIEPQPWLLEAARSKWAFLHQQVPDVTPFYESSHASLLPIRSGGGTRTKVPESMLHGVPVIGTPLTFEGLDVVGCAMVGSTTEELAAVTTLLYRERERYEHVAQLGYERALISSVTSVALRKTKLLLRS